ncbi:MAG: bacterial transcriptional activator domain-containing protein, partial [Solirubrobacterales bacterium]
EAMASDPAQAVASAARRASERLRRDPPPLAFSLFGSFSLRRGGRLVEEELWERRVAERLVRFLLVQRGEAVPEDLLFEAFWPGRSSTSARRSLQVAVSCARAVLDPPDTGASAIEARERSYRVLLRPGDVVDTEVFAQAARTALSGDRVDGASGLRRAVALWGGEPLPEERYEEWSTAWRETLLDLYSELLTALAETCFQGEDPFGATAAARRLVELDPLSEAAHRMLMVAFSRSGRRGHALRQFLDCRRALVDELGLEPAAETAELHRAILAGERV